MGSREGSVEFSGKGNSVFKGLQWSEAECIGGTERSPEWLMRGVRSEGRGAGRH